jgi:hypothetical protein
MSRCCYCQRELPGLETLCQACFDAGYDRVVHPKPWWQRVQLRPRFTRANVIGFFVSLALAFVLLRFDFPYFRAHRMWNTGPSALLSILIASFAFFYQARLRSAVVATHANSLAGANSLKPKLNLRKLVLLVVIEAAAGLLLCSLFMFVPLAVQILIAGASCVIVEFENMTFPKNRSLGSFLCGLTALASVCCAVAWRVTGQELWSRWMVVGVCLMAGLVFLDRRQEWLGLG